MHLLIPVTADRGLAGAFNASIGRATRTLTRRLEAEGKTVKLLAVGRKGRDFLRRELSSRLIGDVSYAGKRRIEFTDAEELGAAHHRDGGGGRGRCVTLVYNRFRSVISQVVTEQQLVPAPIPDTAGAARCAGRRGLRVRAGRGDDPGPAAAAEPGDPDVSRAAGKQPPGSTPRR